MRSKNTCTTKTIGIIGGGQLAQLLGHAAKALGLSVLCLVENTDSQPASTTCTLTTDLEKFMTQSDVVTLENENIPTDLFNQINTHVTIHPGLTALLAAQERFTEKSLFQALNIPCAPFAKVDSLQGLEQAVNTIGTPSILKTRRLGYDGKGQARLKSPADALTAWHTTGEQPAILEAMVDFDFEVSQLSARNAAGDIVHYPLARNHHEDGILRTSVFPFKDENLSQKSQAYADTLLTHLDYVGLLAIEFFVVSDTLVANEFAPRVHNSGHHTIEGANVSQFETHLRAVSGMGLITPIAMQHVTLTNIIGQMPIAPSPDNSTLYDYGKAPRPGRKLGHITSITP
jgi:5-(carboxyamino)imidazole ribonucleotide synthase